MIYCSFCCIYVWLDSGTYMIARFMSFYKPGVTESIIKIKEALVTRVALISIRAKSKARNGARKNIIGRWRSKKKWSSLILCAFNAMRWDILQMVAPIKKSSSWGRKKRSLNMSNASSAALGVTSPQCAQPSNWWSNKNLKQSQKLSKRRHPKIKSRSTMKIKLMTWRWRKKEQEGVKKEQGIPCIFKMPRWWARTKFKRK